MLFVNAGVPALALTSVGIFELLETVVHTPADTVRIVDAERVAETCAFVSRVLASCVPPLAGRPEPDGLQLRGSSG